jgi:hypothetical protein
MIPVETVPEIRGGGGKREMNEGNSSMIHLIHCNKVRQQ